MNVNDPQGVSDTLDAATLDGLRMLSDDGSNDMLFEIIDIFLDDAPARLIDVAAAVQAGDATAAFENAHAVKGSAATLGALRLAELCRQVEAMGRAGDVSGAASVMASVQAEYERVKAALHAVKAAG